MVAPVKRKNNLMIITSPFGEREYKGERRFHSGVDLRSVDFDNGKLQKIQTPENCIVLRFGTDQHDNDFLVVKPMISPYDEFKFIHVTLEQSVKQAGVVLDEGHFIGYTQIKGQSEAHHLHFETWKTIDGNIEAVDPRLYFNQNDIKYKFKGDSTIQGE